ncbi:MAG: alcohol dehydrogenase [Rhodospirillaceae bacterium]|nr:alcohol dehydrogenase [Rhodospirillaceae bacterium]
MVKRARFSRWGKPSEVVELVDVQPPALQPDEVAVDVLATPINPADVLKCYGKYGHGENVPPLPSWGGVEGAGVVAEAGSEAKLAPGTLVAMARAPGMWSERVVVPAKSVIPLPAGTDPEQAAMMSVNPPTAWLMLDDYVDLKEGDWVIQNAANSAVGRHVIAFAKARGIKTINVVRSEAAGEGLTALGANMVLVDGPDLPERILAAGIGGPVRLAIDAVGGVSTAHIASCLSEGAKVVCYGLLSGDDPRLPAELSIFYDVSMHGFWLPTGLRRHTRDEITGLYAKIAAMVAEGAIDVPVAATYPLRDIAAALDHAERGSRGGKIVLKPQE